MNAVFADTYYFLALINRRDQAHDTCVKYSQSSNRPVVTTTWILLELGDALRIGHDRAAFAALLRDIEQDSDTTVIPAEESLFKAAVEMFATRADKEWSLTDCTSFVAMREHGLTEALTQDHHFEQAGFIAVFA